MGFTYPAAPMQSSRADRPSLGWLAPLAVGLVVVTGIGFRLHARSDLWLDEALTVNISKLPVGQLLKQLRHDGHPPLYYLLLHGWMKVFGSGDEAVRLLSGLFGLLTIPLFWVAARRYGGRDTAVAGLVLLSTSPFAVRYSTEARMYSLVILLVVAGWLAVRWALDDPRLGRLATVAVLSGALALTHYWAFYLLAALGVVLLIQWRRGNPAALAVALAIVAGGVLFVPWLPSFLAQAKHTGTPWGRPVTPATMLAVTFSDFGGGAKGEAQMLGVLLVLLLLFGVLGRALDRFRVELDLRTHPHARAEVLVVIGTFALACLASYASQAAFASRYTAVVLPLVLLVAAFGVTMLMDPRLRAALLVVVAVLGLIGTVRGWHEQRTQGGQIGRYITVNGKPGDVIGFCPDQLGPSTLRYVPADRQGLAFPKATDAHLVDWVDYAKRNEAGDPKAFAALLDKDAGQHTVWIVWAPGYRTLDIKCELLADAEKQLRPGGTPVVVQAATFEHAWLYQYGPVPPR